MIPLRSIILSFLLINSVVNSLHTNRLEFNRSPQNFLSILANHRLQTFPQAYFDHINDGDAIATHGKMFEAGDQQTISSFGQTRKRSSIMLNRLKQAFGQEPNDYNGQIAFSTHGDDRRSGNEQGKGELQQQPAKDAIATSSMSPVMEIPASSGHLESLSNTKQPGPRFMALKYDPLMVSTPENSSFRRKMVMSEDEKLMKCFFNPVSCF